MLIEVLLTRWYCNSLKKHLSPYPMPEVYLRGWDTWSPRVVLEFTSNQVTPYANIWFPQRISSRKRNAVILYEHACKTCAASYIGETKRPLGVRSSEHKPEPSPVAIHARTTRHNIPTDEPRVLDQDKSWFGRGVREACYIKIWRSSLNRDGGRYHLPSVYNSILSRLSPSGDGSSDSHQ